MHQETAAVSGTDADVAGEADRFLKGRVRAPVELVFTGDTLRLLDGVGGKRHQGCGRRVVVVEELGEEGPEAQLSAGAGVVRDEDSELVIRDERQIGVEEARVAPVTDDAEAVARLLVEA